MRDGDARVDLEEREVVAWPTLDLDGLEVVLELTVRLGANGAVSLDQSQTIVSTIFCETGWCTPSLQVAYLTYVLLPRLSDRLSRATSLGPWA